MNMFNRLVMGGDGNKWVMEKNSRLFAIKYHRCRGKESIIVLE